MLFTLPFREVKALFYFEFRNNALSLQANSNEQDDRPVSENHIQRK
jgi:hypothetical protein